jgi:hypothetical protein
VITRIPSASWTRGAPRISQPRCAGHVYAGDPSTPACWGMRPRFGHVQRTTQRTTDYRLQVPGGMRADLRLTGLPTANGQEGWQGGISRNTEQHYALDSHLVILGNDAGCQHEVTATPDPQQYSRLGEAGRYPCSSAHPEAARVHSHWHFPRPYWPGPNGCD